MQAMLENVPIFAFLGGWEIVLILAVVLILFGAKRLPEISRGLGEGTREFREAIRKVWEGLDEEASDAGKSVGGIYGKLAAQALTPDNQTAELYDPVVLRGKRRRDKATKKGNLRLWGRIWMRIWHFLRKLLRQQPI